MIHGAGQDLLAVRTVDGREVLVPFVAALVPDVDVAGGRLEIADRPGLLTPLRRGRGLARAHRRRHDLPGLPRAAAALAGRARRSDAGLIDVRVHDLRDWTHDRHRTVDDTPYGGGAGMVMRPEPWGEALDALVDRADTAGHTVLVVPTPGGEPFTQAVAADLASARAPGVRLRPLRGHRPAGPRRGRDPDDGPRGVARRLRAQRRGGRGARG